MATTAPLLVEKVKLAKAPLEMHYLGDRVLRQPAKRISRIDDSLRELITQMLQTMYTQDGIGLAAPQVGINKQLLVVDCAYDEPHVPPLVMINPKIISSSREIAVGQEGCLSIPNVFLDVKRPAMIEVSYKDEHGRPQKRKFEGLPARVIQHEMDHLNGVMFVDRVEGDLELTEALTQEGFAVKHVRPVKKTP
ncbi:MAG: peptide deformylase [Oscillatoriales cyanobacterium]|jgi:peptide deformylase|nr:MAG: peptide deformylase [Oscillatoriales cyanobacterium]